MSYTCTKFSLVRYEICNGRGLPMTLHPNPVLGRELHQYFETEI